jgi:two-component system, sensor histidine kinase and response regulator
MLKPLLSGLLFLDFFYCFAQPRLDSAVNLLRDTPNNISLLRSQVQQLTNHRFIQSLDSEVDHRKEWLNTIAIKILDRTTRFSDDSKAVILAQLGEVLTREKTGGPGYQYIQEALKLCKKLSGSPVAFTYSRYGDIFQWLNRLDSAIYYAEKSLDVSQSIKSDSLIREGYSQLSMLFYDSKNYAQAEYYLRLIIDHPLTKPRDARGYLNTLGLTFRSRNQPDSATKYFEQSLDLAVQQKDTVWIGLVEGNIGYTWFLQKKYYKALPGLLKDVKFSIKKRNRMSATSALESVVEIYWELGKPDLSTKYFDTLTAIVRTMTNEQVKSTYYRSAALFYDRISRPDSAYKNLQRYVDLNSKLTVEEHNLNAAQLDAQFQFDRQIRQIGELERLNQAQAYENRLKNYFLIATGALILLALGLIYALYRNNQFKAKTNEVLQEQNEKISRQAAHLEELNATKDKLFAIIGHDLRAPINSLRMLLSMLKNQMISKEEFDVFMVKVQGGVEQVQLTLNNLLSWSSNQLTGMSTNTETVLVHAIVSENFDLLNEQAEIKSIALKNLIQSDCIVLADPDHLRLVFRNLVSNGIKFTNAGGTITVENFRENGHHVIAVRDTGIGLSEQALQKLFQSAAIFSTTGTDGEKGTGLGLKLCQEVIEKNGGKIWVESEQGKGTVFKFSLQVAR